MPSAASVKVEKPPTTNNSAIMAAATANVVVAGENVDNSSPVRQIAVLVEHKIRNLEKRKVSETAIRILLIRILVKLKRANLKWLLKHQMARTKKTIPFYRNTVCLRSDESNESDLDEIGKLYRRDASIVCCTIVFWFAFSILYYFNYAKRKKIVEI